jgi:hypothetical protein
LFLRLFVFYVNLARCFVRETAEEAILLNIIKTAPQIPVVLASLLLWASFAWGLPAEAPAAEAEADKATAPPEGKAEAVVAGSTANAVAERNKTTGWFYLGLGLGESAVKNWGSDLMAGAAAAVKHGRYPGTLSGTIYGGAGFDVGLLFGYYPHRKLGLNAGVAWVKGGEYHAYPNPLFASGYVEESETVGIPVELQYTPIKGRVVGLGLVAHVNFNKERIFGGVTVGIELGKLK